MRKQLRVALIAALTAGALSLNVWHAFGANTIRAPFPTECPLEVEVIVNPDGTLSCDILPTDVPPPTDEPPTDTPVPPTNTPAPPTDTPVPPSQTPLPSATFAPNVTPPTLTPVTPSTPTATRTSTRPPPTSAPSATPRVFARKHLLPVVQKPLSEIEPNNGFGVANTITRNELITAQALDAYDVYRFTSAGSGIVAVTLGQLSASAQPHVQLQLYKQDGATRVRVDGERADRFVITIANAPAGQYFVVVFRNVTADIGPNAGYVLAATYP